MKKPQTIKLKLRIRIATAVLIVSAAIPLSVAGAQKTKRSNPRMNSPRLVELHNTDQLKELFQRDTGKVRLVALISPTCPMCRWGFTNIVNILRGVNDDRVRAYIVWLPIFGGDFKGESRKLSDSFPNKRVSYFLDPQSFTGNLWETVLKTEREMAWDVYLLYDAGAQWEQDPPQPDFWMHQLDRVTKAPRLDQAEFTAKLKELLSRVKTP